MQSHVFTMPLARYTIKPIRADRPQGIHGLFAPNGTQVKMGSVEELTVYAKRMQLPVNPAE